MSHSLCSCVFVCSLVQSLVFRQKHKDVPNFISLTPSIRLLILWRTHGTGHSIGDSLTVGVLLLLLLLLLLLALAEAPDLPMVDPTLSSNDLKADEFLTSTNFLPMLSPRVPKISVVFSAANLTVSLVFWYL